MNISLAVVSGGFDPIHSGHIAMIQECAKKHTAVVVGLNSDEWLIRKKGKPFMPFKEREAVVKAIKDVDKVMSFDDSDGTAIDLLRRIKKAHPHEKIFFCNGGDRTADNVPEAAFCEKNDILMRWNVGGGKTQSSSDLLGEWKK
jgi:cytidyltransferase-like protein